MRAAYALAALSRSGDDAAVQALCSVLCDDAHDGEGSGHRPYGFDSLSPTQRAAMHGLAAAGVPAVEPLLSLLSLSLVNRRLEIRLPG